MYKGLEPEMKYCNLQLLGRLAMLCNKSTKYHKTDD